MAREIKTYDQEVSTEVRKGGFAALPAGRYEATIFGLKTQKYQNGDNKGREYLNVQFRISEGQRGANRRVFAKVPLFPTWASGGDAWLHHQLGAAVTGVSEEEWRKSYDNSYPDDVDILGEAVTVTLKVVDDTNAFEKAKKEDPDAKQADFQTNEVSAISAPGNGNAPEVGASDAAESARPKATVLDL